MPNLRSRLLTIRAAEQEAAAIGGSHWQGIASEEMLAGYKDNPKIDSKTRCARSRLYLWLSRPIMYTPLRMQKSRPVRVVVAPYMPHSPLPALAMSTSFSRARGLLKLLPLKTHPTRVIGSCWPRLPSRSSDVLVRRSFSSSATGKPFDILFCGSDAFSTASLKAVLDAKGDSGHVQTFL